MICCRYLQLSEFGAVFIAISWEIAIFAVITNSDYHLGLIQVSAFV